jgi:hypothetical protein
MDLTIIIVISSCIGFCLLFCFVGALNENLILYQSSGRGEIEVTSENEEKTNELDNEIQNRLHDIP